MGRHAGVRGRSQGCRATEEVWERFLSYLREMSAIDASKLPGMPSAPAFRKKRLRDPDFDRRAAEIIAGRRLLNGGRRRVTTERWDLFLNALATKSLALALKAPDAPSLAAVYKHRRRDAAFRDRMDSIIRARAPERRRLAAARMREKWRDPEFAQLALAALRAWRHRPTANVRTSQRRVDRSRHAPAAAIDAPSFAARLKRNELYRAADQVVPKHLSPEARADIIADVLVALIEGTASLDEIAAAASTATRQYWKLFGKFQTVSLDAPLKGTEGLRLIDTLAA